MYSYRNMESRCKPTTDSRRKKVARNADSGMTVTYYPDYNTRFYRIH